MTIIFMAILTSLVILVIYKSVIEERQARSEKRRQANTSFRNHDKSTDDT